MSGGVAVPDEDWPEDPRQREMVVQASWVAGLKV